MTKHKWYVVIVGKEPGVYSRWSEVAPLVVGIPGAIHESFPEKGAAQVVFERESAKGNVRTIRSSYKHTQASPGGTSPRSSASPSSRTGSRTTCHNPSSPSGVRRSNSISHPSPHAHIPRGITPSQSDGQRKLIAHIISDSETDDEQAWTAWPSPQTQPLPRVTAQTPSAAPSYPTHSHSESSARSRFSSVTPPLQSEFPSKEKRNSTVNTPLTESRHAVAKQEKNNHSPSSRALKIRDSIGGGHAKASGSALNGEKVSAQNQEAGEISEAAALLSPLTSPRLKSHATSAFNSTRTQSLHQPVAGSDRRGAAPTSSTSSTPSKKAWKGKGNAMGGSFTNISDTPVSVHPHHESSGNGKGLSQANSNAAAASLALGSTPVYYLVPANINDAGHPACPNCDHRLPAAATLLALDDVNPQSSPSGLEGVAKKAAHRSRTFYDPRSPLKGEGSRILSQRPSPIMMYKPEEPSVLMNALFIS